MYLHNPGTMFVTVQEVYPIAVKTFVQKYALCR